MNKEKLSVVMAGAMLASSVAPVLAATESKVDQNELGSLVLTLKAKLTEKRFSDVTENENEAGKSVYYIKIDGTKKANIDDLTVVGKEEELRKALQDELKVLTAGSTVEIVSKGFEERDGKVLNSKETTSLYSATELSADKMKAEIFTNGVGIESNKNIMSADTKITDDSSNVKLEFETGVSLTKMPKEYELADQGGTKNVLKLAEGNEKLDFTHYINANGDVEKIDGNTTAAQVKGFPVKKELAPIGEETIEKITITGVENNFKTEDLYDGLMLTTKGHDLLSTIRKYDKKDSALGYDVVYHSITGAEIKDSNVNLSPKNNEYGFVVTITKNNKEVEKYTIKGAKKQTDVLASWLFDKVAKVDLLAGDNRYATAVEIAKEQANIDKFEDGTVTNDIVLVNGDALVDGLAAAPLAAQLQKKSTRKVPVLLTEAGSLRKETKAYIKELLYNKSQADLESANKNVTVHLVGGKAVLSRALESELKEMGLKIVRYNGDNREETSLEVAEAIEKSKGSAIDSRFVVGANGEADAMSIAPVASDSTTDVTPIILSKNGGISEDALSTLASKNVTVIGGEKVVSAEDFEAINDAVGSKNDVKRVFGANRKATNAAIIKEYYGTDGIESTKIDSVIVAKDDVLVDALTAANLAVQIKAPIVLAKSSLSKEQNEVLNLYGKSSKTLYQVGHGVDTDNVVAKVAGVLGLLNK